MWERGSISQQHDQLHTFQAGLTSNSEFFSDKSIELSWTQTDLHCAKNADKGASARLCHKPRSSRQRIENNCVI